MTTTNRWTKLGGLGIASLFLFGLLAGFAPASNAQAGGGNIPQTRLQFSHIPKHDQVAGFTGPAEDIPSLEQACDSAAGPNRAGVGLLSTEGGLCDFSGNTVLTDDVHIFDARAEQSGLYVNEFDTAALTTQLVDAGLVPSGVSQNTARPDGSDFTLRVYGDTVVNPLGNFQTATVVNAPPNIYATPAQLYDPNVVPLDSVTFNPALISHHDIDVTQLNSCEQLILAGQGPTTNCNDADFLVSRPENMDWLSACGQDAILKKHLRVWYEPGHVYYGDRVDETTWPATIADAIQVESTYQFLDADSYKPVAGCTSAQTDFPFATEGVYLGCNNALVGFGNDGIGPNEVDGTLCDDASHRQPGLDHMTRVSVTGLQAGSSATKGTVELSSQQFTLHSVFNAPVEPPIQFFDHMIQFTGIQHQGSSTLAQFNAWYIGNTNEDEEDSLLLPTQGKTYLSRKDDIFTTPNHPGDTGTTNTARTWFVLVAGIVENQISGVSQVTLTVGKEFRAGDIFYVDGVRYDVPAVHVVGSAFYAITLRNAIPKSDPGPMFRGGESGGECDYSWTSNTNVDSAETTYDNQCQLDDWSKVTTQRIQQCDWTNPCWLDAPYNGMLLCEAEPPEADCSSDDLTIGYHQVDDIDVQLWQRGKNLDLDFPDRFLTFPWGVPVTGSAGPFTGLPPFPEGERYLTQKNPPQAWKDYFEVEATGFLDQGVSYSTSTPLRLSLEAPINDFRAWDYASTAISGPATFDELFINFYWTAEWYESRFSTDLLEQSLTAPTTFDSTDIRTRPDQYTALFLPNRDNPASQDSGYLVTGSPDNNFVCSRGDLSSLEQGPFCAIAWGLLGGDYLLTTGWGQPSGQARLQMAHIPCAEIDMASFFAGTPNDPFACPDEAFMSTIPLANNVAPFGDPSFSEVFGFQPTQTHLQYFDVRSDCYYSETDIYVNDWSVPSFNGEDSGANNCALAEIAGTYLDDAEFTLRLYGDKVVNPAGNFLTATVTNAPPNVYASPAQLYDPNVIPLDSSTFNPALISHDDIDITKLNSCEQLILANQGALPGSAAPTPDAYPIPSTAPVDNCNENELCTVVGPECPVADGVTDPFPSDENDFDVIRPGNMDWLSACGQDANLKKHLRIWYEPGHVYYGDRVDETTWDATIADAIQVESTYQFLDAKSYKPVAGCVGSKTDFPFGTEGVYLGCDNPLVGASNCDDGSHRQPGLDHMTRVSVTGLQAGSSATRGTVELSSQQFTLHATFNAPAEPPIQYFDHMIQFTGIQHNGPNTLAQFNVWYIGNTNQDEQDSLLLPTSGKTYLSRKNDDFTTPNHPGDTGTTNVVRTWFVQVGGIVENQFTGVSQVTLTVGKELRAGDIFYVDGVRYDVPAVHVVGSAFYALTLRTAIPKSDPGVDSTDVGCGYSWTSNVNTPTKETSYDGQCQLNDWSKVTTQRIQQCDWVDPCWLDAPFNGVLICAPDDTERPESDCDAADFTIGYHQVDDVDVQLWQRGDNLDLDFPDRYLTFPWGVPADGTSSAFTGLPPFPEGERYLTQKNPPQAWKDYFEVKATGFLDQGTSYSTSTPKRLTVETPINDFRAWDYASTDTSNPATFVFGFVNFYWTAEWYESRFSTDLMEQSLTSPTTFDTTDIRTRPDQYTSFFLPDRSNPASRDMGVLVVGNPAGDQPYTCSRGDLQDPTVGLWTVTFSDWCVGLWSVLGGDYLVTTGWALPGTSTCIAHPFDANRNGKIEFEEYTAARAALLQGGDFGTYTRARTALLNGGPYSPLFPEFYNCPPLP